MEKSTVPELLGRRIRSLRRSKGLTQRELAIKSNLHYDLIKGIEKGKEDPTLEDLGKISEALGVSMFDLVSFKRDKRDRSRIKSEFREIIDQIQDEEKLQLILEILRALK